MPSGNRGAIHLFRLAGVDLYLHWSWFLIAAYEIQLGRGRYSSIGWNVAEYLALFLIVLTHEFGHAMACRSVGGKADRILLWPLGGVAYVNPPQRPGAMLWSIAAGPLVNVALFPLLYLATRVVAPTAADGSVSDLYTFVNAVLWIDGGLLVFNMLPIYPLDGGQILRSVLWFMLGRRRSLMVATVLGFVGAAAMIVVAVMSRSLWIGAICLFMFWNCWGGLQHARKLLQFAKLPRREGFRCPSCRTAPPLGTFWGCGRCQQQFDIFATQGVCPHCEAQYATVSCLDCGERHPIDAWLVPTHAGSAVVSASFETK